MNGLLQNMLLIETQASRIMPNKKYYNSNKKSEVQK